MFQRMFNRLNEVTSIDEPVIEEHNENPQTNEVNKSIPDNEPVLDVDISVAYPNDSGRRSGYGRGRGRLGGRGRGGSGSIINIGGHNQEESSSCSRKKVCYKTKINI